MCPKETNIFDLFLQILVIGALALTMVSAVDKPTVDLLAPLSELILPSDSASAGKPSEFSAPRSAKKTLAAPTQSTKSNVPAVKATVAPRPATPNAESRSAKEISFTGGSSAISSSRCKYAHSEVSQMLVRFQYIFIVYVSVVALGSNGAYQYAYETDTGIQMQEMGELKTVNDVQAMDVVGGYSYTAPDGTIISVKYVADENGFHPTVRKRF